MNTFYKILFLSILIFCTTVSYAQAHRFYCEITGHQRDLASHMRIIIDFGDSYVYNGFGELNRELSIVDKNGEIIYFNSMIDAMNYMAVLGWNLQIAYSSVSSKSGRIEHHCILYKDAENSEKAREGIVTQKQFRLLNQQ